VASEGIQVDRLQRFSAQSGVFGILLIALLMSASSPVFAHHGVGAYDYSKTIVAKNVTVTEWDWQNPHCKIHFDVTDDRHNIQHWVVEMHPPEGLVEHGWTRQSIHKGDVVSLSFRPGKDYSTIGLLIDVTLASGLQLTQNLLQLPSGKTMSLQEWADFISRKAT
jgi:hypothetical protein